MRKIRHGSDVSFGLHNTSKQHKETQQNVWLAGKFDCKITQGLGPVVATSPKRQNNFALFKGPGMAMRFFFES